MTILLGAILSTDLAGTKATALRIAIQGAPKTGKSTAALTFPNPIVADIDRKLNMHIGGDKSFQCLPFYDPEWCDKHLKLSFAKDKSIPLSAQAIFKWLKLEGGKLEPDQTLIIDSWTMIMDNLAIKWKYDPTLSARGEPDGFKFYSELNTYTAEFFSLIKTLKCNVVVIFHETADRNEKGELTGKIGPLMDGKSKDKLSSYFTDWFRQHVVEDPVSKKPSYRWQIRADNKADCGYTIKKLDSVKENWVLADYKSLV